MITRRNFVEGCGALGLACLAPAQAAEPVGAGTIYSPAPAATPLHALNLDLVSALERDGATGWALEAIALPDSVNQAARMASARRRRTLPIVTTADFALARSGAGPEWHRYARRNSNLLFVSALYDVGFGLQVIDPAIRHPVDLAGRRIAAPPRPSTVRMMAEALVSAGWNLAQPAFVDASPAQGLAMLVEGKVDALAWNLILPGANGFAPMLGAPADARYLPIEPDIIAHVNGRHGFALGRFVHDGFPTLISFAQALAAWRDTPPPIIGTILASIERHGRDYAGLPDDARKMLAWPHLKPKELHPVARSFYADRADMSGISARNRHNI